MTHQRADKLASLLSRRTPRPIPCHLAFLLAVLFAVAGAAEAFPQNTDDIHRESANVEFRHTGQALRLASEGEDRAANPAVGVSMSPQLADNLALLFAKFGRSEFILCLEGDVTETGEMQLRDFRMPHLAYSRPTSAAVHPQGGCDQYPGVVGTLHNHPPSYPEDQGRESSNCYLSNLDITTWLEYSAYPYTAVMCGPRTWAWWHRSQVDLDKLVVFPMERQLLGGKAAGVTVH